MSPKTFDLSDLFEALDEQRSERSLSWAAAVREMSRPFVHGGSRPMAVSTVMGLRTKAVAEGDGVLQMLRWLGRAPESFAAGWNVDAPLPRVADHQVLRLDTPKLHAALDAERVRRGLTWSQAADEIGRWTPGTLAHLAKGGRTGFPHVMRLTRWLGAPLARFVRITVR